MTNEDRVTDGTELYPRMYETIERFVSKFTNNRLHIKEQGHSWEMRNPDDGGKVTLTALVGYLVDEYIRFTDLVYTLTKNLSSDPNTWGPQWSEARTKRLKTAMHLSQTIAFAYAFNLVYESTNEELDAIKKTNAELTKDIVDLRSKLETCQKNYEGLRKLLGTDQSQVGDVSQ